MVNVTLTSLPDPLRDLAFSYAPAGRRAALEALFALDAALGQVLRTTREPMVGQMRFAWWREALTALDAAPPPGEPVLQGLAGEVLPRGVTGAELAMLVDGWEPLLGAFDPTVVEQHARLRGALLFALAGRLLGAGSRDPLAEAGSAWTLDDLARHLSDPAQAAVTRERFFEPFERASRSRWSRNGRALGALVHAIGRDASGTAAIGAVFRLGWHRLTGR